jgi:hypothetical protein
VLDTIRAAIFGSADAADRKLKHTRSHYRLPRPD